MIPFILVAAVFCIIGLTIIIGSLKVDTNGTDSPEMIHDLFEFTICPIVVGVIFVGALFAMITFFMVHKETLTGFIGKL